MLDTFNERVFGNPQFDLVSNTSVLLVVQQYDEESADLLEASLPQTIYAKRKAYKTE